MADWVEAVDDDGNVYYENTVTGDTSWEQPPEMLQGTSSGGKRPGGAMDDRELKRRLQKAEMKAKQAEVKANERVAEVNSLRKQLRQKTAAFEKFQGDTARAIMDQLQLSGVFEENVRRMMDNMDTSMQGLYVRMEQVVGNKKNVDEATCKVERLNFIISNQRTRISDLETELTATKEELKVTKQELKRTKERMVEEIEKVARPLRQEVSDTMDLVVKEKRERKEDREWFSMLWPEGVDMPTILQMYYIPTEGERRQARKKAEYQDLAQQKGDEVKAAIKERDQWAEQADDFGRVYYLNMETNEMLWEEPETMKYVAPEGWDADSDDWKPGWNVKTMDWTVHDSAGQLEKNRLQDRPTNLSEWTEGGEIYAALGADGQKTQFHAVSVAPVKVPDIDKHKNGPQGAEHKDENGARPADIGRKDFLEEDIGEWWEGKNEDSDSKAGRDVEDAGHGQLGVDPIEAALQLREQIETKINKQAALTKEMKDDEEEIRKLALQLSVARDAAVAAEVAAEEKARDDAIEEARAREGREAAVLAKQAEQERKAAEKAEKKAEREAKVHQKHREKQGKKKAAEKAAKETQEAKLASIRQEVVEFFKRKYPNRSDQEELEEKLETVDKLMDEHKGKEEEILDMIARLDPKWAAAQQEKEAEATRSEGTTEGEGSQSERLADTEKDEATVDSAENKVEAGREPATDQEKAEIADEARRQQLTTTPAIGETAVERLKDSETPGQFDSLQSDKNIEAIKYGVAPVPPAEKDGNVRVIDPFSRMDHIRRRYLGDAETRHHKQLLPLLQQANRATNEVLEQASSFKQRVRQEMDEAMTLLARAEKDLESIKKEEEKTTALVSKITAEIPEPQLPPQPELPPLDSTFPKLPEILPDMNREQRDEVAKQRQAAEKNIENLIKEREQELSRREECRNQYTVMHRVWVRDESARQKSKDQTSSLLLLVQVQTRSVEGFVQSYRDEVRWWQIEWSSEQRRQKRLHDKQAAAEKERAKQIVEATRAAEAIKALEEEHAELAARVKAALTLPSRQALHRFERAHLEEEAKKIVEAAESQMRQCEQRLKAEQNRRERKRAEELQAVNRQLLRLQEEAWQHDERISGMTALLKQRNAVRAARATLQELEEENAASEVVVDDGMGGSDTVHEIEGFVEKQGKLTSDLQADLEARGKSRGGSHQNSAHPKTNLIEDEGVAASAKAQSNENLNAASLADSVELAEKELQAADDAILEYEGDVNSTELTHLEIDVIRASQLAAADTAMMGGGKSDPYAVVYFNGTKIGQTQVVNNDLDPQWGKTFVIVDGAQGRPNACDVLKEGGLRVEVYDKDQVGSDEFLGQVQIVGQELLDLPAGSDVSRKLESSTSGGGTKQKFIQGSLTLQFRFTRARDKAIANRVVAETGWAKRRGKALKALATVREVQRIEGARTRGAVIRRERLKEARAVLRSEQARLQAVQSVRALAARREQRWRDAQEMVQIPTGMWMLESEQTRYDEMMMFLQRNSERREGDMTHQIRQMATLQKMLEEANMRLQSDVQASELARQRQVRQLEQTAHASLEMLKLTLKRQQAAMQKLKEEYVEEKKTMIERARREMEAVEERLRMWTIRAHRRGQWVETLRTELVQQRQATSELKASMFSLQKQRADEVQSLRAAILKEQEKSDRLYMWVEAMKTEIYEYEALLKDRDRQTAAQKERFLSEARKLKWEVWRHQVTGQHLHTNVDALFLYFVQGIATLSGTGYLNNERLRCNRGVEVLIALCGTARQEVKRKAAQALGMMGWDGFVEPRKVGWQARLTWRDWVEEVYRFEQQRMRKAAKEFDEAPPHTSDELNTAADRPQGLVAGRRRWAIRLQKKSEHPNEQNLQRIGAGSAALESLIVLCKDPDLEVQSHAANALAITSMHDPNNQAMGKKEGLVRSLVDLVRRSDDVEVLKNGAAALANIGYKEQFNQEMIGQLGGMSVLVELCRRTRAVDVLETASAAIANCLCRNDQNALRLGRADGIKVLLDLCHTQSACDVADMSLAEDVQANAAEALANLTRSDNGETAERINHRGVAPLVQMCASDNPMVRLYAPMVLGNVAQNDLNRQAVGDAGGIEALFLIADTPDQELQRNAMWALSNLAWAPDNQERIGCFMGQLLTLCQSRYPLVQENALVALANALFFHENNRRRVGQMPGAMQKLLELSEEGKGQQPAVLPSTPSTKVQEHALRALGACTHNDENAKFLGEIGAVDVFVRLCKIQNDHIQRHAVTALVNMAVHDTNKRRILDAGGVEALVQLHGSSLAEVRDTAAQAMEILADVPDDQTLASKKADFGVGGMVQLCKTENPLVQGMAAEALAEEVWNNTDKQLEINKEDGVETLLALCQGDNKRVLVPSLWALRNLAYDNNLTKSKIGARNGIETLLGICSKQGKQDPEVLESALSALVNTCIDHERNCRKVLMEGLDVLVSIAQTSLAKQIDKDEDGDKYGSTNASLAADILQLIGPYNYIVCKICKFKNAGGTTCENCGHGIAFEVV